MTLFSALGYITNQPVINMQALKNISANDETAHKRERRKEARPQELIEAALTLFVDKGYAATKVDEVAALAGVSKGTLFLYFDTKEDLFKAVIRANLSEHFPVWNQEFDEFEGSTAEMLNYAMQSWWERIGNTRASGITKLVTSEGSNFPDVVQFYEAEVMRFIQADPAQPYRHAMDLARLTHSMRPKVLAVTHDRGGGTLRHVKDFFNVTFSIQPEKESRTIFLSCVGAGIKNAAKKVT